MGKTVDSRELLLVAVAALLVAAAAGCAAAGAKGDVAGEPAANLSPEQCLAKGAAATYVADVNGYRIKPGDKLQIDFYLNPEFNDTVTVRPDGVVALRLVGDLNVGGLTPAELARRLDELYSSELRAPDVTVHVLASPSRRVYVQGQVLRPGAVNLVPGMTAVQALAEVGGAKPGDAADWAVLIRRDACGNPHGEKLDIGRTMNGEVGEDVALLPGDIIVVPQSGISKADQWMTMYIRNMLPVQPYAALYMPVP